VFNVASGHTATVGEIAQQLAEIMGTSLSPEISGRYRVGDVRHCFADIGLARNVLGYTPRVSLEEGLLELVSWLSGQLAVDRFEEASRELARRGLTV
jgi:dTDP-L-rhamnose 4-epimerase